MNTNLSCSHIDLVRFEEVFKLSNELRAMKKKHQTNDALEALISENTDYLLYTDRGRLPPFVQQIDRGHSDRFPCQTYYTIELVEQSYAVGGKLKRELRYAVVNRTHVECSCSFG
jgi:hypothetical protein